MINLSVKANVNCVNRRRIHQSHPGKSTAVAQNVNRLASCFCNRFGTLLPYRIKRRNIQTAQWFGFNFILVKTPCGVKRKSIKSGVVGSINIQGPFPWLKANQAMYLFYTNEVNHGVW